MSDQFDTAAGVLKRAVTLGALVAAVIAVVACVVGGLVAGVPGVVSGLLGAAFALVFLGITAAGLAIAGRLGGLGSNAFFAASLGGWLVKFVVFLAAMLALRDQPWVQPVVLFLAVVATVLASLVVDVIVVSRARIPIDVSRR
jgi:hypothetical protein